MFKIHFKITRLVKLGGVLISPNVVLTTGLCAPGGYNGSSVKIAADDLENPASNAETFSILNESYISLSPQFSDPPQTLALLQLNGSSAFQPVAMDDGTCTLNAGSATIIGETIVYLLLAPTK